MIPLRFASKGRPQDPKPRAIFFCAMPRPLVPGLVCLLFGLSTATPKSPSPVPTSRPSFADAVSACSEGSCVTPSDKLYAHLVGNYLPELQDATVDGTPETQLEGYYAVASRADAPPGTFDYLVNDVLTAALTTVSSDQVANVSRAIDQMRHGITMGRALRSGDAIEAERLLRASIEGLTPGSSFVLPTSWHAGRCENDGDVSCHGHAVVLEFEREDDGEVSIR